MPDLVDPLDELDALLNEASDEHEPLELSELDGFLAAMLVVPHPPAQAEWLAIAWGGEGPPFPDAERTERLTALLLGRRAEIAGELLRGNIAYQPLYHIDPNDEVPLWELWMEGFARGVELRRDAWLALSEHQDEDLAAAALGLTMFIALLEKPDEDSDLVAEAPGMIPYLVETLYRRQHGLDRVALASLPPAKRVKVGRNDPCPCGSGKKFKKCCG
jgi:uncharacterized protein